MRLKDLAGQKFGRWTVVERAENHITPNGTVVTMWHCKCDCGNEADVSGANLRTGQSLSCGCYKKERTSEIKLEDLTGQRFGRLVVIEICDRKNGIVRWRCKCDCGNETIVNSQNLRTGHTKSCGCFSEESRSIVHTKHGYSGTRLYTMWNNIKGRCFNENNSSYDRYGGRGITMCDEWADDFGKFYDWAYANGYDENAEYGKCTLDRIDNSKGYSPDNCRWVDMRVQSNNRRSNRIVEHNGEKHTLAEWARILGISNSKLIWHLNRGRTIQDVIDNYLD